MTGMSSQRRVEQIVEVASLALLAPGCLTVLRPFLFALAWALILSFSTWPLRTWLVRRPGGRRTLAATLMTLLVAATFILPLTVAGRGLADSVAKVASMVALLLDEGLPGPAVWVSDLPLIGPLLTRRWLELQRLGADWTTELQPHRHRPRLAARHWIAPRRRPPAGQPGRVGGFGPHP